MRALFTAVTISAMEIWLSGFAAPGTPVPLLRWVQEPPGNGLQSLSLLQARDWFCKQVPSGTPIEQVAASAVPKAMFTIVRSSSTVTCPSPLQSPIHGRVEVGAGVRAVHSDPLEQDAPRTATHPPHVPLIGAAQKVSHWQQSVAPSVGVRLGVIVGVRVGLGVSVGVKLGVGLSVGDGVWSTQRDPASHAALKTTEQLPHEPLIRAAQLAGH